MTACRLLRYLTGLFQLFFNQNLLAPKDDSNDMYLFLKYFLVVPVDQFKGPLKYLVAMIRGCHARAMLLPVVRKFFARFLASRRRPVAGSSRR